MTKNDGLPRVSAGERPKRFPARCSHCGHKVNNQAELQTHMRNEHPA